MKATLSFILTIILSNLTLAQTTVIPDANFELALINFGYDFSFNGSVPTANIDTITNLNLFNQNISDLTGIEDFTALQDLRCTSNQLTSLDLSQNVALTYLDCNTNLLTSLNVTQNIALTLIACQDNQLTSIDVSQNTAVNLFFCFNNQIGSLDLTQNSALTFLDCSSNQLTCFNIKGGNNNINGNNFDATNNPNLTCIEVDDPSLTGLIWTVANGSIDAQTSLSTNCNNACSTTGLYEHSLSNLLFYPNPTSGSISIDLGELKTNLVGILTNSLGQVIITQEFEPTRFIKLDVNAPPGVYFLQLKTTLGETKTIKIVKE